MSDGAPFARPPSDPVPWGATAAAGSLVALAALACAVPGPTTTLLFLGATTVVLVLAQRPGAANRGLQIAAGASGLLLLGVLIWLPVLRAQTEAAHRATCRSHLAQLGAALRLYRDNLGNGAYPAADGASFLTALRLSGTLQADGDDLLRCPSVAGLIDGPADPREAYGPDDCSYAGRRNASGSYAALLRALSYRPGRAETVLASDDDEGRGARFNHGDVIQVLFLDGHVEAIAADDPRVAGGPGAATLLHPLAN